MEPILFWDDKQTQANLKKSLENNKLAIVDTDTVPGFLANITKTSFEELNKMKENRSNKPYLILISSEKKLSNFVDTNSLNSNIKQIITSCWPGPLTIIFKAKDEIPKFLTSENNKIALRCPNHKGLLQILETFDGLFSTSANKTDKATPKKISDIDPSILEKMECVIGNSNKQSTNTSLLPSTIIDYCGCVQEKKDELNYVTHQTSKIKVIRKGAYPINMLEGIYGAIFEK